MAKNILLILLFAVATLSAEQCFGQKLLEELPETKEEFIASEKQVLATIKWLETTPFDQNQEKRTMQKELLFTWLTNSPTVTIALNAEILTFNKKNPDLLLIFMGGWARYSLENDYSEDILQGNIAGLKSVIQVYQNLSLKKDKEVEKLIALDSKGELEKWVKEKMAIE